VSALICEVCGYVMEIPIHHGVPMRVIKKGFLIKRPIFLECQSCDYHIEYPKHHNKPMKIKK